MTTPMTTTLTTTMTATMTTTMTRRRDRQAAAAMTTSEYTEELGLQTSTTSENNTACVECLENLLALEDGESICSACSGVCSLTHVIFFNLCHSTLSETTFSPTMTITTAPPTENDYPIIQPTYPFALL